MDCACEGDETRALGRTLSYRPIVPPNPRRRHPWKLVRQLYCRHDEIERFFRQLKDYRCVLLATTSSLSSFFPSST